MSIGYLKYRSDEVDSILKRYITGKNMKEILLKDFSVASAWVSAVVNLRLHEEDIEIRKAMLEIAVTLQNIILDKRSSSCAK